jgi:DNA repair protein RecO (recombination protein O)
MFVNYRSRGFILKKTALGEADQVLTVYTKDFGKLEITAKAVRKISSKLRAGVEIFYLSEIEFIQAKNQKTLVDAVPVEKFENIKKDLIKLRVANKVADVLDELVKGQEKDEKIWQLLTEVFYRLNECQVVNSSICRLLYYYFFWNFVSVLGYEPQLYNCVLCHKKLEPEELFFSAKEGGIICQNHAKELKLVNKINPSTVKILRILLKKNPEIISRLKIEKPELESLGKVADGYYSYIREQLAGT